MPFIFKLVANLLPELDDSHVYSQQDVVNRANDEFHANFYNFINSHTITMHFNPHSEWDLCFRL